MLRNRIDSNDVNGSRLAEQGPSSGRCSRQGNIGRHHADPVNSIKRRKWSSQDNKVVMECYILSEPKIRGYRKRMLSLWLSKGMFWVSEQRLVDQANAIRRNKWMTEIEIEELDRKSAEVVDASSQEVINQSPDEDNVDVREEVRGTFRVLDSEGELDELTEEEVEIVEELVKVLEAESKETLPALRDISRKKLLEEVAKVDKVLSKFKTHSITKTNQLFYAGAVVVTNRLGVRRKEANRKEPMWRRRLESKIKGLRRDLSQLEAVRSKEVGSLRQWGRLERKYDVNRKTLKVVIEELKQRVTATAAKIRRYQGRIDRFRQNRLFQNNQRQFYRELDQEGERCEDEKPDAEESKAFWKSIWGQSVEHQRDARWLKDLKAEVDIEKQEKIDISIESVRKIIGRMPNWKAPGPDLVQGFWLKKFRSLHERVCQQLQSCLDDGFVPIWMTKGRTVLLQKDKSKGNIASNYRPITCLPLMWKLLTGVIGDKIYGHLDQQHVLPEEQKGCRKKSRGTNDLLYIDRAVIREVKSRKKNLAMAWIDYKKAYDMVPHSWIVECLEMFGIAENIRTLLVNSMENWKVMLCSGNLELGEVDIRRGIFQGDSLSPLVFVLGLIPLSLILRKAKAAYEFAGSREKINHLLFMDDLKLYSKSEKELDSLIQTVRIFSEDIGMEFGIEKCAMLVMKRGKIVKSEGIELPEGKVIKSLQEGESYKYLGILEADRFLEEEMKVKVSKEYFRRLRKVLKSKLNGGNLVKGVNTWAVSLLRYSAAFISWTKCELQEMDRKTRKLFTIYGGLHPKSDVDRLYLPRKDGGRGLISIEDCVELAIRGLEVYIHGSEERLIKAARGDKKEDLETTSVLKTKKKEKKLKNWEEKVLHGQYIRQTKEVRSDQSWTWLQNGDLKRETESLIVAAQNQSLRTNLVKAKIDRSQEDSLCRLCRKVDESIDHIVSGCSKLAQKEYKRRHDNFGKIVHWKLAKKCTFEVNDKWYEHEPESVLENEDYKILWDFSIQTDHEIEARRPDLVVVDKKNRACQVIDFAVPGDSRIEDKEREKIEKYQDLARELQKVWNVRVKIIPLVVGSLGAIPKLFGKRLKDIGIKVEISQVQKTVLLGTARILRKVLEI